MSLEIYSKDLFVIDQSKNKKRDRFFFAFISMVGLIAVVFAAWPFFVWQIATLPRLSANIENAPIPQSRVLSASTALNQQVQVVEDADGFSYFVPTDISSKSSITRKVKQFYISIPKLEIEDAVAKVDSLEFKKTLSHFPGTALPGEVGNSFVTGHSILPQFADPKNYSEIFSKLDKLEIGDKIYVDVDDRKYQYIVQYSKVVDPKDVSVLSPISANGKNLSLMTCVPPGTSTKRLIVITSLI